MGMLPSDLVEYLHSKDMIEAMQSRYYNRECWRRPHGLWSRLAKGRESGSSPPLFVTLFDLVGSLPEGPSIEVCKKAVETYTSFTGLSERECLISQRVLARLVNYATVYGHFVRDLEDAIRIEREAQVREIITA